MRSLRSLATAVVVVSALTLTACGPTQHVVEGSEVTVVTDQPFTSSNPGTAYGNTAANRSIAYATNARFNYYNADAELVRDESFGSYQLVSSDPLTVRYTIANGVEWSDGVAVDAADLLLSWAANSGQFTTPDFVPDSFVDPETGRFGDEYPTDVVYFDGAPVAGLDRVTAVPVVSGRSITLVYDEYFVDWELAFQVGVPAHVVAGEALGLDDPTEAKSAVLDAIAEGDEGDLARLSRAWNSDFNFDAMPANDALLVGSGPYVVSAIEPGESVTLTANPRYRGRNQPSVETVRVVTLADPLAAASALADGSADIATPTATTDVLAAFADIDGIAVETSLGGTWEHLDLQFGNSKNGYFDDPLVREAFLKVVPREQILTELVTPVTSDAELLSSFVFTQNESGYAESVAANGSEEYERVDVAGAQALLAQAGLGEAGQARVPVCVLFDAANPRRVAEFQLIKRAAQPAGFEVTNCSQSRWAEGLGIPGAYDAALFGWNTANRAVSAAEARLGSASSISNFNGYSNPEVDATLDELALSTDPQIQRELLTEIDEQLWNDAYGVPLYQYPVVTAHSDRVTGVRNSALDPGVFWNIWDWQPSAVSESGSPTR